jgi:hypothetical protein
VCSAYIYRAISDRYDLCSEKLLQSFARNYFIHSETQAGCIPDQKLCNRGMKIYGMEYAAPHSVGLLSG